RARHCVTFAKTCALRYTASPQKGDRMSFKSFARWIALAAILLAGVASAYADVFGSISGTVRDRSGAPLPGVTVAVTGPVLPKGRETVTDNGGNYSFLNLPPGTYTVTATLAGLGSSRADVAVVVDRTMSLNLKLSPTVSESITVTSEAPSVDMKST